MDSEPVLARKSLFCSAPLTEMTPVARGTFKIICPMMPKQLLQEKNVHFNSYHYYVGTGMGKIVQFTVLLCSYKGSLRYNFPTFAP